MLDDETRARIASNKAAALAKREARTKSDPKLDFCGICSGNDIIAVYKDVFDELVCKRCAAKDEEWQLINKTTASTEYLLPDDTFRHMKHKTVDNPHRKGWSEMKLFLRRHARQEAEHRWGNMELLGHERRKREGKKLERELVKAREAASSNISDESKDVDVITSAPLVGQDVSNILARMLDGGEAMLGIASSLQTEVCVASTFHDQSIIGSRSSNHDMQQSSIKRGRDPDVTADGSMISSNSQTSSGNHKKQKVSNTQKAASSRIKGMLNAIRGKK